MDLLDGSRIHASRFAVDALAEAVISVEITTAERLVTIEREWRDLVGRAVVDNAFLEPALVAAAAGAGAAAIVVLLAWSAPRAGEPSRLIGVWALARQRLFGLLPVAVLTTPVSDHAFLGNPVLDGGAATEALSAMLDALAAEPSLPKLLVVGSLDAAGPAAAVFAGTLARRNAPITLLETRQRPALWKTVEGSGAAPVSSSRAKSLRRRRQRLAGQGEVVCARYDEVAGLGPVVEEFLTLEASGWKGRRSRRGRAILREPSLAAFFRAAIVGLASRGQARITALRLDGRAIAMQLTIRSGGTAFAWKSAYDETLRAYAPGFLLHREVTSDLLADPDLSRVDSCNHDDTGHMAEFWAGRRDVSDLLVDVRPHRTMAFALASTVLHLHRRSLQAARYGRSLLRSAWPRAAAASPGAGQAGGGSS
jgi:CelD/BcsL family acetyltransferase involved in cellulose biosynthesis